MDLPKKFKFVTSTDRAFEYEAELIGLGVLVSWKDTGGCIGDTFYSTDSVEKFIRDGYWLMLAPACTKPTLLEQIHAFVSKLPASVIIDDNGYYVMYNGHESDHAGDEQRLIDLMDATEKFHEAFQGK